MILSVTCEHLCLLVHHNNKEDEGQNLGMAGCFEVSDLPNKYYEAVSKTAIEEDFAKKRKKNFVKKKNLLSFVVAL